MYRTILVPADGSPLAEHSLPWALSLAGPGATIHLAHVHVPPPPVMVEGIVVAADPGLDTTVRQQEAGYLSALTDRVKTAAPKLSIGAVTLDYDDPMPTALAKATTDTGAELVIMTTHGRGPFGRLLVGSVTDDTARESPAPVLVVRGTEETPSLAMRPRATEVLIPLDGDKLAEAIIAPAVRLAKVFGAEVTLLAVADAAKPLDAYLDRMANDIGKQDVTVRTQLVPRGNPADVILAHAKSRPGTIVALATHGRTGLSWFTHGSVAEAVLHGAAGPVLVYHPPGDVA